MIKFSVPAMPGDAVPVVYPDCEPDAVLALVDLLWLACGCPACVPS